MYNMFMEESSDIERRITEIETELADLDHHRSRLLEDLASLRQQLLRENLPNQLTLHLQEVPVNNQSSQEEKFTCFVRCSRCERTLFRAGSII
jgi:hypothetical protein